MPSRQIEVLIEDMAQNGAGIGKVGKRSILVPFTIPGERVLTQITGEQGEVLNGRGIRLIQASADRVYPRCDDMIAAPCVRCGWQHIAYPAQLLLKQDMLATALDRARVLRGADIAPTLPSPVEWAYMHHITYHSSPDGKLELPASGDQAVHARTCALVHPDLLALYDALANQPSPIDTDDEADGAPLVGGLDWAGIRRVRLARGGDRSLMLVLTVNEEAAPELETDFDLSINLLLPSNEPVNLIGDSHLSYTVNGAALRATAGAFFRPNVAALGGLADTVLNLLALQSSDKVLDLYAGVGMFSALIAPQVARVTLIESYPPAVTDADENLAAFDQVDVIEGGVETVLPELDDTYTAAIVDPPSHGLSAAVMDGLAARGVQRLVYVSDNPTILARDAAALGKRGYRLIAAQPVDLMPQTAFVDSVSLFFHSA
jgi:23S rRNA (uracil1939-C5)-methyltransferase